MVITTNDQNAFSVTIKHWDYTHYLYLVLTMTVIMT